MNVDLPANQIGLAKVIMGRAKGRPKPFKAHLADAEEYLADLRLQGFRIVPFPSLKHKTNGRKKRGRRN